MSAERVLIVDDDLDVLGANARYFRVHGFQVVVADSGTVALQRLRHEALDAVVTDLRMPGMSGLEFARQARERVPLMPLLFVSGFARVPDVVAAMRLGAVDFLEKPVEPPDLLERLQRLIVGHRAAVGSVRQAFVTDDESIPYRARVLAYERHLIQSCLERHDGRIADVLKALQINRRTLNEKMSRLGIQRDG